MAPVFAVVNDSVQHATEHLRTNGGTTRKLSKAPFICPVCIGPSVGCCPGADGIFLCARRGDFVPGYCRVGRVGEFVGYRPLCDTTPASDRRVRLVEWLDAYGADAVGVIRDVLERGEGIA